MTVDDQTVERIAENQSTFRVANENIETVAEEIGVADGEIPFICECPDRACVAIVHLDLKTYEEIRRHPRRFFAAAGHDATSVQQGVAIVVEEHELYAVVEKTGIAGEVAEERFERS